MNYEDLPDLEIVSLRKQIKELESKLVQAYAVLRENDLLDEKSHISDVEELCVRELGKFNELSIKGIGLSLEDIRNIDILHKNLLLARGKVVVEDKDKNKKKEKPDIAKLLRIATSTSHE